jgi:DNA-directed RNA polymerase subunit K/omega
MSTRKKKIPLGDDSGEESDYDDMNEIMQKDKNPDVTYVGSDSESENEYSDREPSSQQNDDLENDDEGNIGEITDSDDENENKRKKTIYDIIKSEEDNELDLGDADDYEKLEIKGEIIVKPNERISKPILTKYERVGLLTTRTSQLERGAKPLIKSKDIDINSLPKSEIAKLELKYKVIPLIIQRPIPTLNADGKLKKEQWKITELEFNPNDI